MKHYFVKWHEDDSSKTRRSFVDIHVYGVDGVSKIGAEERYDKIIEDISEKDHLPIHAIFIDGIFKL